VDRTAESLETRPDAGRADPRVDLRSLGLWAGPLSMGLFFVAVLVAHFLPFPSPAESAVEVGAFYRRHANGILLASVLIGLAGTLYLVWTAVLAVQVRRTRSHWSRLLAYAEILSGGLGAVTVWLPSIFLMTAAFRPGRDPVVTQAFQDATWLCLVVPTFPLMLQLLALGLAMLLDRSTVPAFPRWCGYLNLLVAALAFPSELAAFFKTGPFAWNGILTLWLASAALGVWMISMVVVTRRAIAADGVRATSDFAA
jgi:hypothetical protein